MRMHRPREEDLWHYVEPDDRRTICGQDLDPQGVSREPGDDRGRGPAFPFCALCFLERERRTAGPL